MGLGGDASAPPLPTQLQPRGGVWSKATPLGAGQELQKSCWQTPRSDHGSEGSRRGKEPSRCGLSVACKATGFEGQLLPRKKDLQPS